MAGVGFPLILASNAFAQLPAPAAPAPPGAPPPTAEVERVIVTGSNIPTAEETGPNPVDTYRPQDIEKLGIRNATVRKLAVQDLTTTVLTLTITGLAADSFLAGGNNPRWGRRVGSVGSMFAGAGLGALLLKHSLSLALSLCVMVSFICTLALFVAFRKKPQTRAAAQTNPPPRPA